MYRQRRLELLDKYDTPLLRSSDSLITQDTTTKFDRVKGPCEVIVKVIAGLIAKIRGIYRDSVRAAGRLGASERPGQMSSRWSG